MASTKTICVIGSGYVGLPTAAILANCGYKVFALEINPERLAAIKAGQSFFYEAGLEPLIKAGLASGNLIATNSYEQAIPASDVVFSCVGTPDNADGSSNLSYVFEAASQASKLMKPGAIFVQKSTVPVGTGAQIENRFAKLNKKVAYVSNPEFLREATAVADALWPDRVIAGSNDAAAANNVLAIYKSLASCRASVAKIAGLKPPTSESQPSYISASLASAELIKVSANAFLALKISFANSIAKLADAASANVTEVMDGIGSDRRIGRAFLNAGRGYGGGCFPKDVSGLISSASDYGVELEIMDTASEVNASMPHYIIHKAEARLSGGFAGKKVAVLGLSFKAGTSDVRRSPAIAITNTLAEMGASVSAYDPEATVEASTNLEKSIKLAASAKEALASASVVVIATDWPEFLGASYASAELVVDAMNCLPASTVQKLGAKYLGVGIG